MESVQGVGVVLVSGRYCSRRSTGSSGIWKAWDAVSGNDHWWSQKYSEPEEMDEELDYIDEEVSPEITEDLEGISELDIELLM